MTSLEEAERQRLSAEYQSACLAALEQARSNGFFTNERALEKLRTDVMLDAVRDHPDFPSMEAEPGKG